MIEKFFITTSIMYPNAKPHLGFALEAIYADVLARFYKKQGRKVIFSIGTDENSQKVVLAARKAGYVDTKSFVDDISAKVKDLIPKFNLSVTDFIRTTEERHLKAVEKFWNRVYENGDIYQKEYKGLYCVGCEDFILPKDLVNGKCINHNQKPEEVSEVNYFFRLSKYQKKLLDFYEKNPDWIYPRKRQNEVLQQFLKQGLKDFSISRDSSKVDWGIKVPNDPSQTIYVWFDALLNYLTVAGYGSDDDKFREIWPADLHIIGKDINKFHAIFWPAMLMSAGIELPKKIGVHAHITVEGRKMSKSLGNVIDPIELVEKYGVDAVRYFLLREIPFQDDGDFSYKKFEDRYNYDLANSLGNLIVRVSNMVEKYLDGYIEDITLDIQDKVKNIQTLTQELKFDKALALIWEMIAEANQYLDKTEPWRLYKQQQIDELKEVLSKAVSKIQIIVNLLEPYLPQTAMKTKKIFYGKIKKGDIIFPRLNMN